MIYLSTERKEETEYGTFRENLSQRKLKQGIQESISKQRSGRSRRNNSRRNSRIHQRKQRQNNK